MLKIKPDEGSAFGVKIKVVGVGGAGGNAVGEMVSRLSGVDLIALNTDSQALSANTAPIKLQIGRRLTEGLGTGANPEMGKFAANEDRSQISELLKGANVVFLTLGLGGGTGTGAGPVVAKIAKDNGAIVIGFVTFPFVFEGSQRMDIAHDGLPEVRKQLDTLITVPNEKIFDVVPPDTSLKEAFALVNEILYQGVAAISDLITQPGLMNLDFADLRTIVEDGGEGLMGTGVARGANRSEEASRLAISNPFLKREELVTARNILISIAGGENLGVFEVRKVVYYVHQALTPQAKSFCGTVIDSRLEDDLKVTVIATGLEKASTAREEPKEKETKSRRRETAGEDKVGPSLFEPGLSEAELPAYIRNKKEP
ncbi:MAG: cell division protein FtsZ [Candidatus Omnitrophota bacterium]